MEKTKGQVSLEFVISLIIFLLILISMYELSASMNQRKDLIASQFEGEKTASKVANAISWAMISGANSTIFIKPVSYPEQSLRISGAQVLSFGLLNNSLSIAPIVANTSSRSGIIATNQTLKVIYNGSNISITQLG